MTERPLVSVVMATRDSLPWLTEALDSIESQTYSHHETVVVDGDSADGSAEAAAQRGARVFAQREPTGFCGAWNEGLERARGELIAFLDSDDRWEPRKLEWQVDLLRRRPEVACVIGQVVFFLHDGMREPPGLRTEILEGAHEGQMPGTLLARRAVFEALGTFDTSFGVASDIEWFARLKDSDLVLASVPEVVIHKRVHDHNVSHFQAQDLNRQIVRLLRESVARRRDPA